jgi:hypothetical protein
MASKSLKPRKKYIKRAFVKVVFALLGKAVKACYALDSRIKIEFDELPDNTVIKMSVLPMGPSVVFKKEYSAVSVMKDYGGKPDLHIVFKNIESAILSMGLINVQQSYAESRFIMYGDMALGTAFVRIMNIVEAYLYPRIWTAYLFNNQAPVREKSAFRIYAALFLK